MILANSYFTVVDKPVQEVTQPCNDLKSCPSAINHRSTVYSADIIFHFCCSLHKVGSFLNWPSSTLGFFNQINPNRKLYIY